MSHTNAGSRWLAKPENGGEGKIAVPQDATKAKLIVDMRAAVVQNRPQAANALLKEWEEKERERLANESAVSGFPVQYQEH